MSVLLDHCTCRNFYWSVMTLSDDILIGIKILKLGERQRTLGCVIALSEQFCSAVGLEPAPYVYKCMGSRQRNWQIRRMDFLHWQKSFRIRLSAAFLLLSRFGLARAAKQCSQCYTLPASGHFLEPIFRLRSSIATMEEGFLSPFWSKTSGSECGPRRWNKENQTFTRRHALTDLSSPALITS